MRCLYYDHVIGRYFFMAITRIFNLLNKFPNTYMWRSYNEHFRKVRAFAAITWRILNTQIVPEVDEQVETEPKVNNYRDRQVQDRSTDRPCYNFHKVSGCDRNLCLFVHKWTSCNTKGHPVFKCVRNKASNDQACSFQETDSFNNSRKDVKFGPDLVHSILKNTLCFGIGIFVQLFTAT